MHCQRKQIARRRTSQRRVIPSLGKEKLSQREEAKNFLSQRVRISGGIGQERCHQMHA
jgi:hypothetical protein